MNKSHNKHNRYRSEGFRILANKAKIRNINKMTSPSDYLKSTEEEKVSLRENGNLLSIKMVKGGAELASVLKYVDHENLQTYASDNNIRLTESQLNNDYAVLGTYHYKEVSEKINDMSDRPTLNIIIVEVLDDYNYKIITDTDESTMKLLNAIRSYANDDPEITDRCNELLKATVVSLISGDMSDTYHKNMMKVEKELKDTDDNKSDKE